MTNETISTGSCPANAATQLFLMQCPAVTAYREVDGGERFEFDYDVTVEVSYVPESLEIEW